MATDYENRILFGDALQILKQLPDSIVQTCVTSPPYWGLRDYSHEGQIGLEKTPEKYVGKLTSVFSEVNRVLKDDGTLWLNLGDSYASSSRGSGGKSQIGKYQDEVHFNRLRINPGLKPKNLCMIPARVAMALQANGWYLRSEIIWHKPNPMPESVKDRPTNAHEKIYLLSKSKSYYYDSKAIEEPATSDLAQLKSHHNPDNPKYNAVPDERYKDQFNDRIWGKIGTRNKRTVWKVASKPYNEAHFATFPADLITPCIKAGSKKDDLVLDPFIGSGTTAEVALKLGRNYLGIDLQEDYKAIQNKRLEPLRNDLFVSKTFAV